MEYKTEKNVSENVEDYSNPTAGKAIGNVEKNNKKKREQQKKDSIDILSAMMRELANFTGFEVVGSIKLKDRITGKRYDV